MTDNLLLFHQARVKTRKLQGAKLRCYLVLEHYYKEKLNNGWVPNYIFLRPDIGGVAGLRRVRELTSEFGIEYDDPKPVFDKQGKRTGVYCYRLRTNYNPQFKFADGDNDFLNQLCRGGFNEAIRGEIV